MTIEVPVLIVGAGPVGLMAGLLLDQQGIDYRIVERRPALHHAPQAHVVSHRTLEICRSVGIDDGPIRAAGPAIGDSTTIRWVDRLAGRDLGVFSMMDDDDAVARMLTQSPTPLTNLSQDLFEAALYNHLEDSGRILFSHAWQGFSEQEAASGYLSSIAARDGSELEVRSEFVIAADGAGSRVRKAVGIDMVGPDNLQTFVNVHFRGNLRPLVEGRESLLYWVMEHDVAGTFVAHDIDSNWIYSRPVPPDEPIDPIDEEKFGALVRSAIGVDADIEIVGCSPWRMTAQIADTYRAGKVFLVGDAAHRFPPTGGLGMNTGIGDAHNLVWKIAMVLRGFDEQLLDTYEPERKPSAQFNSDQSVTNAMKMFEVAVLLDVDGDGEISSADIDAVLGDPALQAAVQGAVNAQSDHFKLDGMDLGVCYAHSSVVVADGEPPVSPDPLGVYVPSTTPGCRLPHASLQRNAAPCSTLDLVRPDAVLVLAASPDVALDELVAPVVEAGLPITTASVGGDSDLVPTDGQFESVFSPDEILLVRPDGHIGARLSASASTPEIARAVEVVLPPRTTSGD